MWLYAYMLMWLYTAQRKRAGFPALSSAFRVTLDGGRTSTLRRIAGSLTEEEIGALRGRGELPDRPEDAVDISELRLTLDPGHDLAGGLNHGTDAGELLFGDPLRLPLLEFLPGLLACGLQNLLRHRGGEVDRLFRGRRGLRLLAHCLSFPFASGFSRLRATIIAKSERESSVFFVRGSFSSGKNPCQRSPMQSSYHGTLCN